MALDRYGQQFNEGMRTWMTRRSTQLASDGHTAEALAIDTLVDEARQAMEAGWQPWQNEWEIIMNSPAEPKIETPDAPESP